ncbi:MAG: hypothetical protein R3Y62_08250, partial [Eubacteriales bacterium]
MKKMPRLSLRRMLYLLISVCWIIPLLISVGWFATEQEAAALLRMEESIETSVQHAADETVRRLSDAMIASRAVSYDGDVGEFYKEFQATDDYMALYNDTHSYLQTQFAYNEAFA